MNVLIYDVVKQQKIWEYIPLVTPLVVKNILSVILLLKSEKCKNIEATLGCLIQGLNSWGMGNFFRS